MAAIQDFMQEQHRCCDTALASLEDAVNAREWDTVQTAATALADMVEAHLQREEQILFPAFEEATGMTGGPTAVMRTEHDQMRALLAQIVDAATRREADDLLSQCDTMMVLTQQHNMKEEQVLYPMTDQHLADAEMVVGRMRDLTPPSR